MPYPSPPAPSATATNSSARPLRASSGSLLDRACVLGSGFGWAGLVLVIGFVIVIVIVIGIGIEVGIVRGRDRWVYRRRGWGGWVRAGVLVLGWALVFLVGVLLAWFQVLIDGGKVMRSFEWTVVQFERKQLQIKETGCEEGFRTYC